MCCFEPEVFRTGPLDRHVVPSRRSRLERASNQHRMGKHIRDLSDGQSTHTIGKLVRSFELIRPFLFTDGSLT